MKNQKTLGRLAFIKYLYDVGVEQSRRAEPFCWVSVLTFHDAAEHFLALASEYFDLGKRLSEIEFMGYWPLLSKKLAEEGKGELTQKISMEKLNRARVDFKHYGNPPSKSAIEDFRVTMANFFEENTPLLFDIQFSDISLIELVECEAAKNSLKEAEKNLKEKQIEDSLDKVALGFAQLIDDYESRKTDEFGRSPFFFGKAMHFLSSFFMGIKGELGEFIDKTKESVEALQEAVKILSLGLDYRRYSRFRLLTPIVLKIPYGKYQIQRIQRGSKGTSTPEDVRFCIDFIIESAITLQEFDFQVERVRHPALEDLK
jgi:hypothetical protein